MLTEGFSGNADMLQRFYREASQTGALRHNNIVIVYDAGDQDGEPYIVMEYVEGEPLDRAIKRERMQLEHALTIVEQLCHALAYAHRNGVIHRDIKPANVILRADGSIKLLDFGIARDETRVDTSITSTGSLVGTPPTWLPTICRLDDRWPVLHSLRRRAFVFITHWKATFRSRISRRD